MSDANELVETPVREVNREFIRDIGDITGEEESFTFEGDTITDDLPPSLLSYFETSKSRAAICEKLILEGLNDITASHCTVDKMNLPYELDEDVMKLSKQVTCEKANEEDNSATDTLLLSPPTETEALSSHYVFKCPNNEVEAKVGEYVACEQYWDFEARTLRSPVKEEEINESTKQPRGHREGQQSEEMTREEQRRQREREFQQELKKMMEAEKLQQKKLELMGKEAQEKLEQEFLLQQELISELKKRVERERKMQEEEQKRLKEEEERKKKEDEERKKREEEMKKKEEETIKREMERKRFEEEKRRKKEDEKRRKIEEMRLKEKHRQEKEEEEEKRRRKEEEHKIEDLRKREEERRIKEIRLGKEKRRQVEEEEGKRIENEVIIKEIEKNRKIEEEGETRKGEKEKKQTYMERQRRQEEKKRKNEEVYKTLKEEGGGSGDQEKRREEEVRMKQEEMKSIWEERKCREEIDVEKKSEVEKIKLREEEENIMKDEKRSLIIRSEDKRKTKEAEQEEEMRQEREEDFNNIEEEIELREGKKEDLEKAHKVKDSEMEQRKTKDKEMRQEEVKGQQQKDSRKNIEADTRQITEDVKKSRGDTEERGFGEEEESNKVIMCDTEEERASELQEMKGENGMKLKTENSEDTNNSLTSQPEDQTTCIPSGLSPFHSESTAGPICSDLNTDIIQTSTSKSMGHRNAAEKTNTSSGSSLMCLPKDTEKKRQLWMKECISWSRLSLQNRRKQNGHVRSLRGPRRTTEADSLPPLCLHTLLQSMGCKSLQEVTTVSLEDLTGCSLTPLAQCTRLQSLTLRRCGLKSLEAIKQLSQLCYIDVQENDISYVDCENMSSLRVLRLGHNKLMSIHGLNGTENLDFLEVSHNCISRIAGLESMKRLQRLSVDHNQLISTKGLRDICTLVHLDCSHNHLASVEGLESCALLHTLDLNANCLTEPPSLTNHILLRELHLDDNSISSLQGLAGCWLPLMHHLSVAQNRITLLPSMSDFVSLASLDLRFNCMSDLQNVCENLEGCQFLREVHLAGNPLQQESRWRSALQKALPGLRAVDGQETDIFMSAPAVPRVSAASGDCFLTFCQAQLNQTRDLQQQHDRELSNVTSHLDAVNKSCRHFTETLKLAVDQRFAHECGDHTVSTKPEIALDMNSSNAEKFSDNPKPREEVPLTTPNRNNINGSYWSSEERQKCGKIGSPPAAEEGGEGGGGKPEPGPSYINKGVVEQDYAAAVIQAFWRGFALRRRLSAALAAVTCPDSGEDETFEELDMDEFVLDEATLEKHWTLLPSEFNSPSRHRPVSEEPLSLKPLEPFPELSQHTLPPLWRPKQAWVTGEQVDPIGQRISPESSHRNKSSSSSALSGQSARAEKILEEWGFTDGHTAHLMLRRAQKMKPKKQRQKKHKDPSACLAFFRNSNYQRGPVEANKPAPHKRNYMTVCEPELGLRQEETTEQVMQGQTQWWFHTQSDRDSESEPFLPEIGSDILNGGRVQLVVVQAEPGHTERLHHTSGLWANSNSAAQPRKERNYPCKNSLGHTRREAPSPHRVTSAPLKKERISFRDNPVQLSGGWGAGKKRDKVYK
ncbi:leucine-rich repeat and IQ domain-containing protein 1 [Echeneis naucrates]|uniref:leucine-rich repeat and IQ domain-containing protein 1 n=1 Tax=Echeneis naucrates TaxID=173247 RepID=UPI00111469D7|nr:leucine-rich repeat and IQ domain-containing protein 1 [Echeneis naucrates]